MNTQQISEEILKIFKEENLSVGTVILGQILFERFYNSNNKLNSIEKDLLPEAISLLENNGLIKKIQVPDGLMLSTILLTEAGFDKISADYKATIYYIVNSCGYLHSLHSLHPICRFMPSLYS